MDGCPVSRWQEPDDGPIVPYGLLLDLLASGDRAGVDAALEVFASGYAGRWWEALPSMVVKADAS